MQLVGPLAAGILGAASGSASIYKRGTTTLATWYRDFEATQSVTAAATLDANGGAEVYVDEYVDVVVRSADGATVRTFTAGDAATSVEVRSPSFTGTNYVAALTAAGQPVPLADILDLWLTSAGATDFKVDVGGVATLLKNAVAAPQFYNPKDAKYGAVGDGAANDSAAIQAAFDAAHAAGGGWIFFPPGTYLITDTLTWYNDINILGCGPAKSILSMDDAAHDHLSASGNSSDQTLIVGMSFQHAQTSTGVCVNDNSNSRVHLFLGCTFGTSSYSTGLLMKMDTSGSIARIADCAFFGKNNAVQAKTLYITDSSITLAVAAAGTVQGIWCGVAGHVSNCRIDFSLSSATATGSGVYFLNGSHGRVTGCYFDMSAASATMTGVETQAAGDFAVTGCQFVQFGASATGVCVSAGSGANTTVTGCKFPAKGSASVVTAMVITGTTGTFSESGNAWVCSGGTYANETDITAYTYTAVTYLAHRHLHLGSRDGFHKVLSQNGGGTLSPAADQYRTIEVEIGDNTAFTINPALAYPGATLFVMLHNGLGVASGVPTWGTNVYGIGAGSTLAAGVRRGTWFVCCVTASKLQWMPLTSAPGDL